MSGETSGDLANFGFRGGLSGLLVLDLLCFTASNTSV